MSPALPDRPIPEPAAPGQESVWAFPRPAIAQASCRAVRIVHRGVVIAETGRSVRTLETSHPPSYYIPQADIAMAALRRSRGGSFCEWKGSAIYYDVVIGDVVLRDVAWSYPDPTAPFAMLKDHIAFYAAPFDQGLVDGTPVTPQPGGFYGGWITPDLAGPFKGVPGSRFW